MPFLIKGQSLPDRFFICFGKNFQRPIVKLKESPPNHIKDAAVVSQLLGGNVMQRVFLLVFVLLFHHSVSLSQRHRIRVPQDKHTIQDGVNSAKVGDTVLVDHGLYYENIRINKNIVLASRLNFDLMRSL